MTRDIQIPPDDVPQVILLGAFRYLLIKVASQPFLLSFDRGSTFQLVSQNMNFVRPDSDRIIVKAYGGSASTVTLFYGMEPVTSQDTVVTSVGDSNLVNNLAKCAEIVPGQILKTMNVGAPQSFVGVATYYRWAIIQAQKSFAGAANAGNVRIGVSAAANSQPIELAPGDTYALQVPTGAKVNFQNWYLSVANNGDGITVLYL